MPIKDSSALVPRRGRHDAVTRGLWLVIALALARPLLASDAGDGYVLAQAQSVTPSLVAQTMDADFIAVPVTLVPTGDTLPAIATTLEQTRTALQAAFKEPYRVSIQPRAIPTDAEQNAPTVVTTTSAVPTVPLLPAGMRFAVLIVRPLNQLDPEPIAFAILARIKALGMTTPHCVLEPGLYRLGLGDPERFRHDLLLRLERITELTRSCVPKTSKAWLSGLEAPLTVSEASDGRQVVVSLPFQLRFEESQ